MASDGPNLDNGERLQEENEFLKMKLMLERDDSFVTGRDEPLPADVENQFLNYIEEYEKQFEQRKTISVFNRIECPTHFKAVTKIPDGEIDQAWKDLSDHLNKYGISLDVCSPNISTRELYRFTTEELFKQAMSDIRIPGMMTNFIYDEFYPDPVYDNSRMVEGDLFNDIFSKRELFYEIHYDKENGFIFNKEVYRDFDDYKHRIENFKSLFGEIELLEFEISNCKVEPAACEITGKYKAVARDEVSEIGYAGSFKVGLILKDDFGYWYFKNIQIEGFEPK